MPGNEAELKGSLRANAKRDDWSEVVLLGGLFLEVALLFVFSRDRSWIETGSLVFANVLVFLGVFGSWHFGGKARRDGEELQRLSEEAIAVSNRIAEEARERTARIELLTARRHMTPEQCERFIKAMREIGTEIVALVEYQRDDSDAYIYAHEWLRAFRDAGVTTHDGGDNSFIGGAAVFGIHLWCDLTNEIIAKISALFCTPEAPFVSGHTGKLPSPAVRLEPSPNLYVFVGPKPPPEWSFLHAQRERPVTDSNRAAAEAADRAEDAESRLADAERELAERRQKERVAAEQAAWGADWIEGRE